jgi:hypothetical protein
VQANREFLGRVVGYLAEEIAKDINRHARVVYVDYDPMVVVHSYAILEDKPRGVAVAESDLCSPGGIIDHPQVQELIDFTQPVAVLMTAGRGRVLPLIPRRPGRVGAGVVEVAGQTCCKRIFFKITFE